ncbi:MAG: hypothetical protein EA369_05120 [Bradymonadales bacterium]|nr:MAG: hypothetical protein EA369_05120 [Bradymonadales bacterium]
MMALAFRFNRVKLFGVAFALFLPMASVGAADRSLATNCGQAVSSFGLKVTGVSWLREGGREWQRNHRRYCNREKAFKRYFLTQLKPLQTSGPRSKTFLSQYESRSSRRHKILMRAFLSWMAEMILQGPEHNGQVSKRDPRGKANYSTRL